LTVKVPHRVLLDFDGQSPPPGEIRRAPAYFDKKMGPRAAPWRPASVALAVFELRRSQARSGVALSQRAKTCDRREVLGARADLANFPVVDRLGRGTDEKAAFGRREP